MQLTNETEEVTHILLGAKESGQFSMEESAAFFDVLSKSLYSDPMLAAIREPICNAWDAHIAAGKTDVPIAVNVSSEGIVIRDFGSGIAHEDINNLYCRYGKSTKRGDEDLTGGFGVGCKAPYAYTDHFEVISYHNGTARVYAMSRHPETNFPMWNLLAEAPTEETGVQVSIPSRDHRAERLAAEHAITSGSILATLNGVLVPTLDFSDGSFALLLRSKYVDLRHSSVYVQYGSVLYPVDPNWVHHALQHADLPSFYKYILCIKAPAGSLSIPPSREALRDTEHTRETLKELLSAFVQMWQKRQNKAKQELRRHIKNAFTADETCSELDYAQYAQQSSISAWEMIAAAVRINSMSCSALWHKHYIEQFIARADITPVMRRQVLNHFGQAVQQAYNRIIKITLRGGLDLTRLYAYTGKKELSRKLLPQRYSRASEQAPTITITTRKEGLPYDTLLVYKVARKGGDYQKALDVFNKAGFVVIDMVPAILAEPPKQRATQPAADKTGGNTALRGLPTLRNLLNNSWNNAICFSNVNNVDSQTCTRNTAPKFVVHTGTSGTAALYWLHRRETLLLLAEYADDGVYATTTEAYARWKAKGIPDADTFLAAEIRERLLAPPDTLQRLANHRLSWRNEYGAMHTATGFTEAWPIILEAVGIPKTDFTLADPKDAALWRWCQFGHQHTATITARAELMAAIQTPEPTTPEQEALAGKHWFLSGVNTGAWYEWRRNGKDVTSMIQKILKE